MSDQRKNQDKAKTLHYRVIGEKEQLGSWQLLSAVQVPSFPEPWLLLPRMGVMDDHTETSCENHTS